MLTDYHNQSVTATISHSIATVISESISHLYEVPKGTRTTAQARYTTQQQGHKVGLAKKPTVSTGTGYARAYIWRGGVGKSWGVGVGGGVRDHC